MGVLFNVTPSTKIFSCYSPTNASDETDIIPFYNELSSLVWNIPKHNVLIICRDINAHIDKNENNKFCLHNSPYRNGECPAVFFREQLFVTKHKNPKKEGKSMDIYLPKAQLDNILISKECINSTLDCEAYSSFERVSSDHRIVSTKIRLSLHGNKKQTGKLSQYDWSSLAISDISYQYTVNVGNKFDNLQETSESYTSNDECEKFVTPYIEAAAESLPSKPKVKWRVLWESITVRENEIT